MNQSSVYKLLADFDVEARRLVPGYEVRQKRKSLVQRAIGRILFFNKNYMEARATALYPRVYIPKNMEGAADISLFAVLAHEFVHIWDVHQSKIAFPLKYAFPQILALLSVLSLLGFWNPVFLVFLGFLTAALPLPAYWRMQAELRGYAMSLAVQYWLRGRISEGMKHFIAQQFSGWAYYRMWPREDDIFRRVAEIEKSIQSGEILEGPENSPFRVVRQIIEKNGLYVGPTNP
jgi:uncharacterized membrane protein